MQQAADQPLPNFQRPRRTAMANVGSGIWNRHHDFTRPVRVEHNCDVFRHIPVMAHYLSNDVIIHNTIHKTLFFMDGLLELKNSPRDIIIIDGNIAHGVTNVIDSGSKDVTERFSGIIFCKWRREKLKRPGKYSGINV
eukprot:scaffold52669_cov40-Cyclotella_meneghiniana.AAC.13